MEEATLPLLDETGDTPSQSHWVAAWTQLSSQLVLRGPFGGILERNKPSQVTQESECEAEKGIIRFITIPWFKQAKCI